MSGNTGRVGESPRAFALASARRLLIRLPDGYDRSAQRYPGLYLLDGEWRFHPVTGIVDFLAQPGALIAEALLSVRIDV